LEIEENYKNLNRKRQNENLSKGQRIEKKSIEEKNKQEEEDKIISSKLLENNGKIWFWDSNSNFTKCKQDK